jgi:hypothetical protein
MDPKLKESIDNINSLNVSPEEKTALFGKLMESVKAQYPPAPPMNTQPQSGMLNQPSRGGMPNTQQGFNVAGMNSARQGGGPLSQNMPFYAKPNIANVVKNSNPKNWDVPAPDLNALKARVGYSGVNDPANTRSISMDEEIRNSVHAPLDGSIPTPTMPNKYNDLTNQYGREGKTTIDWRQGINPAGILSREIPPEELISEEEAKLFEPPPSSMFDDFKEYMFAGKDQKGLFGGTGIDPNDPKKTDRGSMGLSGAFGRLFDNPNRMAMLSGGLTAMDPSSYYDREGFSSPWTGLRSG